MHTLPARLGALFDSTHTSTGPLQSCHSSSSHVPAPPRRLPAQTSLHAALPRIGIVAAPDESLATSAARLSQQQQQQQSQPQQPAAYAPQRRVQVRRSRVGQWPQQQQQQQHDAFTQQPTQLLEKQLHDVQFATQAQQQQLWQAQPGPAQQYQGRQQAWPGQQSQQAGNSNQQAGPSNRHHTSAADQQQPQQQWQGTPRAYRADQQGPHDAQHAPQWQQQRPAQHQQQPQQYQQRPGQGQGYQPRPQQQQQHQQQSGSRWGPQGGSGWQSDFNQQQQQQGRQQQQPQRHQHQQQQQQQQQSNKRLTHPDLSDGGSQQLRFSYGLKQDWSLPTGMAVTYLGSSSGAPTKDRNVSCTMLRLPASLYLVDCGEGSSRQAKLTGLPLEQVEALFITHLHGDHCFGIGTMLVAMCKARGAAAAAAANSSSSSDDGGQLSGPDSPGVLRVVGPPRLGEVVSAMLYIAGVGRQLDQPVYITEFVESRSEAHDWQPLPVPAAAASAVTSSSSTSTSSSGGRPHCQAFIRRMAPTQELPEHEWPAGLARRLDRTGLRWQDNNTRRSTFRATPGLLWQIPCSQVTVTAAQLQHRVPCWGYVFEEKLPATAAAAGSSGSSSSGVRGRRVVLLGDTVDSRPIAPVAIGADLVSHEATFAAGMEGKAAIAQHSTAWMAGQFAWAIQAKALVLTHFSARYEGSRERSKWLPAGAEGNSRRGGGGGGSYDAAAAADAMEEERTIKALQREADDQYGLGPVGLAIDLLTAHVPKQQLQQEEEGDGVSA